MVAQCLLRACSTRSSAIVSKEESDTVTNAGRCGMRKEVRIGTVIGQVTPLSANKQFATLIAHTSTDV